MRSKRWRIAARDSQRRARDASSTMPTQQVVSRTTETWAVGLFDPTPTKTLAFHLK
jgi:hypothetical protein